MPSSSAKAIACGSVLPSQCRAVPMCGDFREDPECPGLVATLVVLSGEIEGTSREVGCVNHPTREEDASLNQATQSE